MRREAGRSLDALSTPEPYQTAAGYVATLAPLAATSGALNAAQGALDFHSLKG